MRLLDTEGGPEGRRLAGPVCPLHIAIRWSRYVHTLPSVRPSLSRPIVHGTDPLYHHHNLGYSTLIRNYVDFLHSKLRYHHNHPEFNGTFDYKEYISLKGIDDPNEG